MDFIALKNEITTDPEALGYAGKQDGEIADLLNAKNFVAKQYVAIKDIQSYVDQHGLRLGIENSPDNSAEMARYLFAARYDTVDTTSPAFGVALDGLVAASLISSSDKGAILNLADVPASRAEVLFGLGSYVSHIDVAVAMRGNG